MNAECRTKSSLTSVAIMLLLALFVLRGIMLAAVLPPFEGWDEYQHLGYIDRLTSGEPAPIFGEAVLNGQFLRAVAKFPVPDAALPAQLHASNYADYWKVAVPTSESVSDIPLYQAQHPSTYYRLMSPIYRLCGGRSNLLFAVSVLRLINLALGAGALLLVLLWIRCNLPTEAALPIALWVAFQPLLLLNVVRVANDALAYFQGTAVVVVCLSFGNRRFWFQTLLLAFLLPLAVLTKLNNLALAPWLVIALILQNPRAAFMRISLILTVFVLTTWHYFAFNLNHFGILAPMQESVINQKAGRTFLEILRAPPILSWLRWTRGWWIANAMWVGGWSFLRRPSLFTVSYEIVLEIAGIGLLTDFLRHRKLAMQSTQLLTVLFLIAFVETAMLYHGLQSYSAFAGQLTTNPWYAAVASPWWLIVLATSAMAIPWRRCKTAVVLSFPLLCLIGETTGLIFRMIPFYSNTSNYPEALRRLSALHPSILGTPTFVISAALNLVLLLGLYRIYKTSVARG